MIRITLNKRGNEIMELAKKPVMLLLLTFILLVSVAVLLGTVIAYPEDEYVYYGFVPVSGDVPTPTTWDWVVEADVPDWCMKFDIPRGNAFLEIVAKQDGTHIEVRDLIAEKTLCTADLNNMELYAYYIKYGTYFKVVSNAPISVSLSGGTGYTTGYSSPYIAADGDGFVGKHFKFIVGPTWDTYMPYRGGENCLILALEDTTVTVVDSTGEYAARDMELKQGGTVTYLLRSRSEIAALGNSWLWEVTSTNAIMVGEFAATGFTYLPAVTGGYVGRLFFGASYTSATDQNHAFILVVPVQDGKVTIYDTKWNKVNEKTFTSDDVEAVNYWYLDLGTENKQFLVKSEGDIMVACGDTTSPTGVSPSEYYVGDDIAFLGAKPNQLLHFFVPTSAVVFAPTDLTVTIDDEPKELTKDSYVPVGSGAHTLKATDTVIIQILAKASPSGGWYGQTQYPAGLMNWGSVLPSPQDINAEKEIPQGFEPKPGFPMEIIAGVAVAAIIAVIVVFRVRKSRAKV